MTDTKPHAETSDRPVDDESEMSSKSPSAVGHTNADSCPVVNMSAALLRVGGDSAMLNEMVNYFFEDSPQLIDAIHRNTEFGNAEEVARAAHSLKGLCANFNAYAAIDAAKRIEQLGMDGDLASVAVALEPLRSLMQQLCEELALWQSGKT